MADEQTAKPADEPVHDQEAESPGEPESIEEEEVKQVEDDDRFQATDN